MSTNDSEVLTEALYNPGCVSVNHPGCLSHNYGGCSLVGMGDLLKIIRDDFLERGIKSQRERAAFVKERTGFAISQQMWSKMEKPGGIKNPHQSAHVAWTLAALGRDANGELRMSMPGVGIRDTAALEAIHFTEAQRKAIGERINARLNNFNRELAPTQFLKQTGWSIDDLFHLINNGTESLPVLKTVSDLLGESIHYLATGLGPHDAPPIEPGPVRDIVEAARARTSKAPAVSAGSQKHGKREKN